jgi:D-alanine--D-alanine ligase
MAFKLAVICGGPSLERGISLNSARSLMDHLTDRQMEITALYVDRDLNFYLLPTTQLYSNTPSDFDFKLHQQASPLDRATLASTLAQVDLVFPAIHGAFGEDGRLQDLLDELGIPYVGGSGDVCRAMFHKNLAMAKLKENGYETLPSLVLNQSDANLRVKIETFFKEHALTRAVVKPVAGGSSIGVSSVSNADDAFERALDLAQRDITHQALLEPFCEGNEFTVVVCQNDQGHPVALVPTEIEISYENGQIFDYRRKYLPTANTLYHTPPRFSVERIAQIRSQAEELFTLFGMRDFARLDGWILKDGRVLFTDFNPISGMEQNSFLFRQACVVGMSHGVILQYVIASACRRNQIPFTPYHQNLSENRRPVAILFGGKTAERQVSLMSGTNVWLKLRASKKYHPQPFLLDFHGLYWELPYAHALNHTVEEIYDNCMMSASVKDKLHTLVTEIQANLGSFVSDTHLEVAAPKSYTPQALCQKIKQMDGFAFLGFHGGEGEDGTFQQVLVEAGIPFNGSGPQASALCMDKFLTAQAIANMAHPHITALPKRNMTHEGLCLLRDMSQAQIVWDALTADMPAGQYVIKPRHDGCSAGIVPLSCPVDLQAYATLVWQQARIAPAMTFTGQSEAIEMSMGSEHYMVEPFIQTDQVRIMGSELTHTPGEGWLELTCGVLESKGSYHALSPSITVAEGAVLSLEEKFQGGTGVNLTPPPESLLTQAQTTQVRMDVELAAKALGIENYARIDLFVNRNTGQVIVIEANSLPALTPSTVIYHQALAEEVPMTPRVFLEHLIETRWGVV